MFNKLKEKNTALTEEEKKIAEELHEASKEQEDEPEPISLDELFAEYDLEMAGRLAYTIADHLAEVTAERFSDMIDGMEMDTAKEIVRRLEESDEEAMIGMLQEMFLIKGMTHAAEDLDLLRDCLEYDQTVYWRFQDTLSDTDVFEWFRLGRICSSSGGENGFRIAGSWEVS